MKISILFSLIYFLLISSVLAQEASDTQYHLLKPIEIIGVIDKSRLISDSPSSMAASISTIKEDQWEGGTRIEDLAGNIPGMLPKTVDAGITSAISLRGFTVQKIFYNGLPDIRRRFVRDLATVDSIQVLRGAPGNYAGINAPGGTVWMSGGLADFNPHTTVSASLGTSAWRRIVLDTNQPMSKDLAVRVIGQWQDGYTDPGNLVREHDDLILSGSYRCGDKADDAGIIRLQLERQHNTSPYSFGTVFIPGSGVQYNRVYAAQGQPTSRITDRYSMHWSHAYEFSTHHTLVAEAGAARGLVTRDETLLGFFTIKSANLLSGYYTRYHDDYYQANYSAKLSLQGQSNTQWGTLKYRTTLDTTWERRGFVFSGVQNIGGFNVDVSNPDFSKVDITGLATTARKRAELTYERTMGLMQLVRPTPAVELQVGARSIAYDTQANSAGFTLKPVSRGDGTLLRAAGMLWPEQALNPYLQFSQSLEPNTGFTRDSSPLKPQRSAQWEMGTNWHPDTAHWSHVALFRTRLRHLSMPDPQDKTALINAGEQQVQGVEIEIKQRYNSINSSFNLQYIQSSNIQKTSSTQGSEFVGAPKYVGTIRTTYLIDNNSDKPSRPWHDTRLWLQGSGISQQYANPSNSITIPGYGLWSIGFNTRIAALHINWEVEGRISNLFNRNYTASVTNLDDIYQGPKRQVALTVKTKL